ncbi:Glyoxalase-like domain protein [Planctomycetes bacterium Pla163]|uniref:Glyoxalase-like domain protein n=1 Tax=Rohdeia mirabilis TaxID=2528008 RepID=A0A518CX28_9BACT|nr:Glyoxalase-like domain protein [Planctomycetes bacterium Pla163]
MEEAHFILYVASQEASTRFYSQVLAADPLLDVPGMTQFGLPTGAILGLMPEAGIKRLLGARLPDPSTARGVPRAELYLLVGDAHAYHERALAQGATELSPVRPRDWGHDAGYVLDLDGHVVAFAMEPPQQPEMASDAMEISVGGYSFSSDKARVDLELVHRYLSQESYWARGRSLDVVRRSIEGSLCFGVYAGEEQVGFARVVTDGATFAWLCDVFVVDAHKGAGIGKRLLERVLDEPALQGLKSFLLATNDAHDLYAKYGGFGPLEIPGKWMIKRAANE